MSGFVGPSQPVCGNWLQTTVSGWGYVRGWVNYYGRYYKSALTPVLRCLERSLVYWVRRKFKRYRRHQRQAVHWLGQLSRREPDLFEMWRIGIRPATGQ